MAEQQQDHEYMLAGIATELERLGKQHRWMLKTCNGKLIFAPVDLKKDGLKVLDIGCADGMLLRDIQQAAAPSAQLVGMDLMPSFIEAARAASVEYPNIRYAVQDVCEPLPSEFQSAFHLTHVRAVLAGAAKAPLKAVVENLVASLAPGGWLQIQEMDIKLSSQADSSSIRDFITILHALFTMAGQDPYFANQLEGLFRDAGLDNVSVQTFKANVGKAMGNEADIDESIEPFKLTIPAIVQTGASLNIPESVTADLEQRFEKEMREVGGFFVMIVVTGQKKLA
ncbi:S-adenosyl-L-methionine-dependent methyltransferase [Thozetella sp. PMI_491]|nr:S-adenosyl-L-methionine-dependent methyltransferase [Thozetella sp. PMI_491]